MPIRVVRLGTPRTPDEGPRLGNVRRPPRGVKKQDYAARDYYDAWLPELSPSAQLLSWSIGCYCEDRDGCHRVILEDLLRKKGAVFK